MKKAILSLSGGMDSSTLLLHLLGEGYQVTALSFDYGQKHKMELERAESLVGYINSKSNLDHDYNGLFFNVRHQVIKLEGLPALLNSALVDGGKDVPEGHYEDSNMKETVVPNRNKIFSSIIQAVALSEQGKSCHYDVVIAMGIHAGDHAIYPDCRQEFRDADHVAFCKGNWDADKVEYYTPYLEIDKAGILVDGAARCIQLGLDFEEVYKRTNTSYKPLYLNGKWYSDYKSASSVERVEAFIKCEKEDPVEYADEDGPKSWEFVKDSVTKVLRENHLQNQADHAKDID